MTWINFPKASVLIGLLTITTACSSNEVVQDASQGAQVSDSKSPLSAPGPETLKVPPTHEGVIERNSAGDADFAGLYATFELKATLMNSTVNEAMVSRQADYYQWDAAQIATAREKATQEMSSEATVFLSFSTPERKNDNLADNKSIWRILLDSGGRRYVGKVKRDRRLPAELQSLFPYHTRWNTPYIVTFPVAMTAIEAQSATLTLTGPLGTRKLEFVK